MPNLDKVSFIINETLDPNVFFIENNIKDRSDLKNIAYEMSKSFDKVKFNLKNILISELICAKVDDDLSVLNTIKKLTFCDSDEDVCKICTNIGEKMSSSLIRIASQRIFSEPEQSIMELPVNSIDSYIEKFNKGSKIGKFGMGFYSFFYWLIDHPSRVLSIISFYEFEGKVKGFKSTVKELNGVLVFSLQQVSVKNRKTTGTLIYLDCINDKFTDEQVDNFNNQIYKLHYIKSVRLEVLNSIHNKENSNLVYKNTNQGSIPDVKVHIETTEICVFDHATGITPQILLGSLFVPSISTKTIKLTLKDNNFISKSDIVDNKLNPNSSKSHTKKSQHKLLFLVADVAVVEIKIENNFNNTNNCKIKSYDFFLTLPSNTRIPVSRDDIILDDQIGEIFKNSINKLMEKSIELNVFDVLQTLFKSYNNYTSNLDNRFKINEQIAQFEDKYQSYLVLRKHLYSLDKLGNYKASLTYNALEIEKNLEKNTNFDNTIWYQKKVVIVENNDTFQINGCFPNFIFVCKYYTKYKDWIQLFTQSYYIDRLNLISNNSGKENNKLYQRIYKNSKYVIESDTDLSLYMSVLSRFDSLDVFFDNLTELDYKLTPVIDIQLIRLSNILITIHKNLENKDWREICMSILQLFSTFKGNQTYGENSYTINISIMIYFLPNIKKHKSDKLNKYVKDTFKYYINSINEENTTILFIPIVSCITLYYEDTKIIVFLRDIILEISESSIEWNILYILFNQHRNSLINITESVLISYIRSIARKIRALSFSIIQIQYILIKGYCYSKEFEIIQSEVESWFQYIVKPKLPLLIMPLPYRSINFNISQLISYLFNTNIENTFNLHKVLNEVKNTKVTNKLQVTEIAINEGSTKSYIEAVLTELLQNSVDAIREFAKDEDHVKNDRSTEIVVNTYKTQIDKNNEEIYFVLEIQDYIGISQYGFINLSVPFISTKKVNSEISTGEMGSGFFNIYREAKKIIIVTTIGKTTITSTEIPIKDAEGRRVIDVRKEVSVKHFPHNDIIIGTSIKIFLPYENYYKYLGEINYFMKNIASVISPKICNIYYNYETIQFDSAIVWTNDFFEIILAEYKVSIPSQILTKGIPFSMLDRYVKDRFDTDILDKISHNIFINVKNGAYTPVQTRNKIRLTGENKILFEEAIFKAVFYKLIMFTLSKLNNLSIPNNSSTAQVEQLRFSIPSEKQFNQIEIYEIQYFFTHFKFDDKNSIASLINDCIVIMGKSEFSTVIQNKVVKSLRKTLSDMKFEEYTNFIIALVIVWLKNKNKPLENVIIVPVLKLPTLEEDIDSGYPKINIFFEVWIDTWKTLGVKHKINKFSKNQVNKFYLIKGNSNPGISGLFNLNTNNIVISTETWNVFNIKEKFDDLNKILLTINNETDVTEALKSFKTNKFWSLYLKYSVPSSTLIHELEHSRRGNDSSYHDSINESIFLEEEKRLRTFEQSVNDVYNFLINKNFYMLFIKNYKTKLGHI